MVSLFWAIPSWMVLEDIDNVSSPLGSIQPLQLRLSLHLPSVLHDSLHLLQQPKRKQQFNHLKTDDT
eukprot:2384443-Amphidinium_carterae.1